MCSELRLVQALKDTKRLSIQVFFFFFAYRTGQTESYICLNCIYHFCNSARKEKKHYEEMEIPLSNVKAQTNPVIF